MDRKQHSGPALYRETQRFARVWFWLVLAVEAPAAALIAYGNYRQLIDRVPWGNRPMSDGELLLFDFWIAAVLIGVTWLMRSARLEVQVFPQTLDVNFVPLRHKRIPLADIVVAQPRTFSPIGEYGGWGLRLSLRGNGWGYFICGNRGVQLVLRSGKKMLVGSQRPEDLTAAIRKAQPAISPQAPMFSGAESLR